jgi:arsenate reductase
MSKKRRVLFLCTGNSCRSHMGEGLLRLLGGQRFESHSAGSRPAGYVHPLAVRVMAEVGVDISAHSSKSIAEFVPPRGEAPDVVVSVCDSAAKDCPAFPGRAQRLHWPFADPVHVQGNEAERLAAFRKTRDEIRRRLEEALQSGELDG